MNRNSQDCKSLKNGGDKNSLNKIVPEDSGQFFLWHLKCKLGDFSQFSFLQNLISFEI